MIGRPYLTETEAACLVHLDGLDSKPRRIYGEDTFQALALAVEFAKSYLKSEEERGIRFVFEDDSTPAG